MNCPTYNNKFQKSEDKMFYNAKVKADSSIWLPFYCCMYKTLDRYVPTAKYDHNLLNMIT